MAQNPQIIFGNITKQATKNDREKFDQWYLQTYQQKFSWGHYLCEKKLINLI